MHNGITQEINLLHLLYGKVKWLENHLKPSQYRSHAKDDFCLTAAQSKILLIIQEQPSRISELGRKIGISKQAAHKTVGDLVKSGFVELLPDPRSKSAKLVRMTNYGKKAIRGIIKTLARVENGLAGDVGYDKLQILYEVLGRKWDQDRLGKTGEEKDLVAVQLNPQSYEILKRLKLQTGESTSSIMNNALMNFSGLFTDDPSNIRQVENGWNQIRDQLKDLEKKHMDESQVINRQRLKMDATQTGGDESLPDGKTRYREILEHSFDVIYRLNLNTQRFDYVSPASAKDWLLSSDDILARNPERLLLAVHPADREEVVKQIEDSISGGREGKGRVVEYRAKVEKGKGYRWLSQANTVVFDKNDQAVAVVGNVRDITERKRAEEKLLALVDQLERKIKEYAINLEEKNAALRVLLKQNREERSKIEEKVHLNMKELILPVVDKLKFGRLNDMQKHLVILESNLNQITSSFSSKVTSRHLNLSHQELQISNYIIHGKTTKEIAELMGLSNRTIDFHRANIRKKLGLTNKKNNLRTKLLSLV